MLKNYITIALRTLKRQKGYAFINVFGLALGIACCTLLFLFVRNELSYDRFYENAERIYRVVRVMEQPNGEETLTARTPVPLSEALQNSFPEVEAAVRLADGDVYIQHKGTPFQEQAVLSDTSFFDIFSFPLLKGNPATALASPNSVVLTESSARKYFGDEGALGQSLSVTYANTPLQLQVTGVVADPPATSSLQFDLLLPFSLVAEPFPANFREMIMEQWNLSLNGTFVLLDGQAAAADFNDKMTRLFEERSAVVGEMGIAVLEEGEFAGLRLQPLTDIHLNPDVETLAFDTPANPLYAYLLAAAALLVLLIACINFTTLALGRSSGRAKEIGVRKVVGAVRGQIRRQFWGEALLTSGAALVAGLVLAQVFLPVFNELAGKELSLHFTPVTLLFLAGLMLLVGLLSGSYPALVLSRFEPTRILRGRSLLGGGRRLTRTLIVAQFTFAIILITGGIIISAQLRFMESDLGFNRERVVRIEDTDQEIFEPFRQEALRHPRVEAVSGTQFQFFGDGGFEYPLVAGDTGRVKTRVIGVSEHFLDVMGIELVTGRELSAERDFSMEEGYGGVLVNEAFVRAMGWESAVGKEIPEGAGQVRMMVFDSLRVVGVVEDVHLRSMHLDIQPLVLIPTAMWGGVSDMYVRIAPENIPQTLAALEETWQKIAPDQTFNYTFLDEVVEEAYRAEHRWQAIIRYASGFALIIACFGLFGLAALAALAAERRTKEIGIRKVLGASASSLAALLSKDFLKLVGIAFLIAVPVAYLAAQRWLQQFAYRIDVGPSFFLFAGGIVCIIALVAVSYQAIRAALADPVQSLRSE